jgi:hypothetical protein
MRTSARLLRRIVNRNQALQDKFASYECYRLAGLVLCIRLAAAALRKPVASKKILLSLVRQVLLSGQTIMAEGETNPQRDNNREKTDSAGELTPEELAAFSQALEEMGKMDLSQAFKASGMTIETAPDGTQAIGPSEGREGMEAEAFWASALLPPFAASDALPTSHNQDQAMGLFDKFRICLCSDVTGVITKEGKPVEGAEIVRRLDLFLPKDQVYIDATFTDANGRFAFKPAYARRWKPMLAEVRTDQQIVVRYEDKVYLGWTNIRSGLGLHEDLGSFWASQPPLHFPLNFNGDLSRAASLPEDVDLDRIMRDDGFFNSQIVYVASRLNFIVTMNGVPAVGAKVVRRSEHVGYDSYEQSKVSDRDGEVDLPPLIAPQLEHRWAKTEIRQKVVITYEGKAYLAWEKTKTNPWENGEYNPDERKWGLFPEITAELTDDPNAIQGIKTDPERCWRGESESDFLPDDAILYKGLFQVVRYDPGYEKNEKQ